VDNVRRAETPAWKLKSAQNHSPRLMFIDKRLKIILVIAAAAVIAVMSLDPIAQDPAYHNFADRRAVSGIPNFYNVLSNFPFIIVGVMGLRLLALRRASGGLSELKNVYCGFFAGVFLTGFGSAYYHYHSGNETLLWDRLPMTIAFMAFFSVIVGEYISPRIALKLFVPLLLLGVASVVYWHISELRGNGDLRPYVLVQFLPVLLMLPILWLYESKFDSGKYLWGVIGAYALSKLAEFFDAGIYSILGIFSGHALKHLLAALGAFIFYCALRERKVRG
jgi:hypothetical protein